MASGGKRGAKSSALAGLRHSRSRRVICGQPVWTWEVAPRRRRLWWRPLSEARGTASATEPPAPWEVAPAPGGVFRLVRANRERRSELAFYVAMGLAAAVCALAVISAWADLEPGWSVDRARYIAMFCGLAYIELYMVVSGLWELFGYEEWFVQAGVLERRRTFPGWEQTTRYQDATLEIGCSERIDSVSRFELQVVAARRKHTVDESKASEDVRQLGLFLSEQTGWPLHTSS